MECRKVLTTPQGEAVKPEQASHGIKEAKEVRAENHLLPEPERKEN